MIKGNGAYLRSSLPNQKMQKHGRGFNSRAHFGKGLRKMRKGEAWTHYLLAALTTGGPELFSSKVTMCYNSQTTQQGAPLESDTTNIDTSFVNPVGGKVNKCQLMFINLQYGRCVFKYGCQACSSSDISLYLLHNKLNNVLVWQHTKHSNNDNTHVCFYYNKSNLPFRLKLTSTYERRGQFL